MKIVITEMIWSIGIEGLLSKGWEVVYDPELWRDRGRLRDELRTADAVIVRNQTRVDADLLGWNPRLRVVGRLGVGLDNIDLQAAAARNIPVVAGRNANATSVAEYVISGIFALCRSLPAAAASVKAGEWDRKKYTGAEISGRTLSLIGVGEIGHRVALRARMLGMKVIGYDPFVAPYDYPVAETGIALAGFEQVLREADFVSLHIPLTAATRNLIDRDALCKMKPTAVLINSARGGIVNEADLYEALSGGKIAGALLDVLEQEPPPADHPLLSRSDCLVTPHIAGLTEESQIRTAELVAAEVAKELEGRVSLCRVRV